MINRKINKIVAYADEKNIAWVPSIHVISLTRSMSTNRFFIQYFTHSKCKENKWQVIFHAFNPSLLLSNSA